MGKIQNRMFASTLLVSLLSTSAFAAPSTEAIGDQIALDFIRILSIALTFGIGFGIGWLFSDKGKTFRKYVGLAVLALIALNMLTSNSLVSHGMSTLVTFIAFFVDISLGFGPFFKDLFGNPTTFGSAE